MANNSGYRDPMERFEETTSSYWQRSPNAQKKPSKGPSKGPSKKPSKESSKKTTKPAASTGNWFTKLVSSIGQLIWPTTPPKKIEPTYTNNENTYYQEQQPQQQDSGKNGYVDLMDTYDRNNDPRWHPGNPQWTSAPQRPGTSGYWPQGSYGQPNKPAEQPTQINTSQTYPVQESSFSPFTHGGIPVIESWSPSRLEQLQTFKQQQEELVRQQTRRPTWKHEIKHNKGV